MKMCRPDGSIVAEFAPEEIAALREMKPPNVRLEPMSSELVIFTPDEIQAALDKNLAAGLRQLADAIEAGTIDGRCIDCQGNGFTGPKVDARAHLMLRIDLAAPIRQTLTDKTIIETSKHTSKVFAEIYRDHFPQSERPLTDKASLPANFTCPKCGTVSYNPNDLQNRYCGVCHLFFGELEIGLHL